MDLMRRRIIMGSILAAVGSGLNSRAQISVCPSCGREHGPGMTVGPHCKASLTAQPPKEPARAENPPADEPASPDGVNLPIAVAVAEFAAAKKAVERGLDWTAIRQARNTRALASLSREGGRGDVMQGATQLIASSRKHLSTGRSVCPVCEGSGGKLSLAANLRGEVRKVQVPNSKCDACGGEKTIPVKKGMRALANGRADQIRAYEAAQEGKGFARSGKLWLPSDVDVKKLPARQLSGMRRAFSLPCETCGGLGGEACEECKGAGLVVCPQEGCTGGRITCPECKGTKFSEETRENAVRPVRIRCPKCNSLGHVECPECGGRHFVRCEKCDNTGSTTCKDCHGSGVPPDCRTCKGEGYGPCKTCKGSGKKKGVDCTECNGTGERLCDRCDGFGVAQK